MLLHGNFIALPNHLSDAMQTSCAVHFLVSLFTTLPAATVRLHWGKNERVVDCIFNLHFLAQHRLLATDSATCILQSDALCAVKIWKWIYRNFHLERNIFGTVDPSMHIRTLPAQMANANADAIIYTMNGGVHPFSWQKENMQKNHSVVSAIAVISGHAQHTKSQRYFVQPSPIMPLPPPVRHSNSRRLQLLLFIFSFRVHLKWFYAFHSNYFSSYLSKICSFTFVRHHFMCWCSCIMCERWGVQEEYCIRCKLRKH